MQTILTKLCNLCKSETSRRWLRLTAYDKSSPLVCESCYYKTPKRKHYKNLYKIEYHKTVKSRFLDAKSRAKARRKTWTLTFEEYRSFLSRVCFYCKQNLSKTGVGLDRIDNAKGYTKDNVIAACGPCNESRSNHFTVEEWKIMREALSLYRAKRKLIYV